MPRKPPSDPPAVEDHAASEATDEGTIMVAALTDSESAPEPLPTGEQLQDPPGPVVSEHVVPEDRVAERPGLARAAPRSVSEIHLKGILELDLRE